MRVIVTGSRHATDPDHQEVVDQALMQLAIADGPIEALVVGGAPGIDSIAEDLAHVHKVKVEVFRADWEKYGKGAGPRRNQQMVDDGADAVLAFPMAGMPNVGTWNCVKKARAAGIPVTICLIEHPKRWVDRDKE